MHYKRNPLMGLALAAGLSLSAPAVASAANYEAVYLPGSPQLRAGFFRISVTTGEVTSDFGASTTMSPVPEAAPLPAGDYHLSLAAQPATADGKIWWSLARMDGKSGRSWILTGGGAAPFVWVEMAAPKLRAA